MTLRHVYRAAVEQLRADGHLSDATLLDLCEGNEAHADDVASRLVRLGEATADGFDLRYTGTPPSSAPGEEDEIDLFVSYAHTDDAFGTVRALVERFQSIQLDFEPRAPRVFYDRRDIRSFDDWEHRILSKLSEAKAMLIVLSPAYFESAYCRKEWEIFLERERTLASSDGAIMNLYAIELPGFTFDPEQVEGAWMQDLARRQWTDVRGLWQLGPAMLEHDDAPAFIERVRQDLTTLVDRGTRALTSRSTVPPPSKYFVGRQQDLAALRTRLLDGRLGSLVAAQGLGGMGKSALAFAYAQAYAADYPGGRYLLSVEGQSDLTAPLMSQAPTLGVEFTPEESRDPARGLARIHAALTERGPALLVLDNVSKADLLEPSHLARVLPPADVDVLATTRLTPSNLHLQAGECQEVGPLPEADALRLLDKYRPFAKEQNPGTAEPAARDIVQGLGGYPLAVEVVAVYLWKGAREGVTYEAYRDRLEREGFAGLEKTGADRRVALSLHEENQLSRLLGPTIDGLSDAERAAVRFAAVLPPDAVVWPWLRALLAENHPGLIPEAKPGYPDPWRTLQDRLHGLRLLTPTDTDEQGVPRVSRMHRLVREVLRQRMSEEQDHAEDTASALMLDRAKHFLNDGWVAQRGRWELIPLANAVNCASLPHEVRAALANLIHDAYRSLGHTHEARRLLEQAICLSETYYSPEHVSLSTFYANLSNVAQDQGDLPEARRLLEEALHIGQSHYAPDHPILGIWFSNLGNVVRRQGDLPEARRLLEEALRIGQSHYSPDHPSLAARYSNLGLVAQAQGKLPEARRLLEEALRIGQSHYSPDHPTLGIWFSNLGLVAQAQGDLTEARRLLEEALRINQIHHESDHILLATYFANLGSVVRGQGDLAEARRLLEEAIRINQIHHEPDHILLATYCTNLGNVVKDQGDLPEARRLLEEAIRIKRLYFHEDNLTFATSYSNLGDVAQKQGDLHEARRLLKEAIRIYQIRHESNHPSFATLYGNLGVIARKQGDLPEARRLLEKAIGIGQTNLPSDHSTLGIWYFNLSIALWHLAEEKKAQELMKRAFTIFIDKLGAAHLQTILTWSFLQKYDPDWVREQSSKTEATD